MDIKHFDYKEKDVDMKKIKEKYAGKTPEELDAEFQKFKEKFEKEHPN
ncbi:hypothetical protein [Huintestinicola sp.]